MNIPSSNEPGSTAEPLAPRPPVTATLVPPETRKPGHPGLIIGVIAALLLAGGGAAAYFGFIRETPIETLEKAVAQLETVKAVDLRSSLTFVYDEKDLELLPDSAAMLAPTPDEKDFDEIFAEFDGRFDWMNEDAEKHASSFRLMTRKDGTDTERFGLETGGQAKILYVKLRMPEKPEPSFFDLTGIKDRWIKIDIEAIEAQIKALLPSAKLTTPEDKTEQLTDAQKAELKKAFYEANVVTGLKIHPNERIDGVPTRHFTLQIDDNALRAFFDRAAEIAGQESGLGQGFEGASEKADDVLRLSSVDVWISKKDGTFKRIQMPLEDARTDAAERVNSDGVPIERKVKMIADVVINSFNQPVSFEAPTDAKDAIELFQEFMGSMEGGSSTFGDTALPDMNQSKGERILSEIRQIQTGLELAYSETTEYPVSQQTTAISWADSVLCKIGAKPVWLDGRAVCKDTIFFDMDDDGYAIKNVYAYSAPKGGQSYELRFDLPEAAGGFQAGRHCANSYGIAAGACDMDQDIDGLMDRDEARYGTDPTKSDTDGDGFDDGTEVKSGNNPRGPGRL